MLLESLVKATVELQGFRVVTVTGDARGLVAELAPDLRYAPRCGQCGDRGGYRDTRRVRHFRHVPLWGIPVALRYAPRRVRCSRCDGVHVEAMPWVSGTQQLTRARLVTLAMWARALPWQQVARLFRCSWGAQEPETQVIDRDWPKELTTTEGGTLVVYQPQVETWTDFTRLEGRVAMAFTRSDGDAPEVGTARMIARTDADLESRLVRVHSLVLEDVRFPSLSADRSEVLAADLRRHANGKELVTELDRIVADVERAEIRTREVRVNTAPPQIFVSQTPAIVVQFDGEPVISRIQDREVKFVVNTNWDVLQDPDSGRWYLLSEGSWLEAPELEGPWARSSAPSSFGTLPDDENWTAVRNSLPGQARARRSARSAHRPEG